MTRKDELRAAAVVLAGPHQVCEDPWYSCPKSPEGCADDRQGPGCTCGVEDSVRRIYAALQRVEREVWEKVIASCDREACADDERGYIAKQFGDWCREQAKEV